MNRDCSQDHIRMRNPLHPRFALTDPCSSTEGSAIPVPRDDWDTMSNTRRKVPSGAKFKPGNTLNRSGPGANTLPTMSHRGANVPENTAKRQKTTHGYSFDDADDISEDSIWNRSLQEQPSAPPRKTSIISLNSQSQETPSQKADRFTHNEVRNVHSVLNYSKKKGRKPKNGGTLPSSPHQGGTVTDPVSVDDNDDVQILSDQRSPPRSAYQPAAQKTSYGEADGHFARKARAQENRNQVKPATYVLDRIEVEPPRSPPLAATFVRDVEELDEVPSTHQARTKVRNRMQSASNTARSLQTHQTVEDLSEDELSREPPVQSSARKSKQVAPQRAPSPNHIYSTHFTKGRRKAEARDNITIALSSLRMRAGNWEDLYLIYSWENKAMQFFKDDEMLLNQGVRIQLGSKHVHTLFCSTKSLTAAILSGCTDSLSSGKIFFQCASTDAFDQFLEAVNHMNNRATVKDLAV